MIRNFLTKILPVVLFVLSAQKLFAQAPIYAIELVTASSDFQYPERATDGNRTNYAYISNLLTVLPVSSLRVRFPEYGQAGDVVNVTVQGSAGLLSASVLDNLTLRLYDSAGTTAVATGSSASVLSLSLLTGGTYVYNLQFITSIADNYRFKDARLEINNLLSASLTDFRVYGFSIQKPCPPVYASRIIETAATPILASVENSDRIVDSNPNNYASLYTAVSLLGIGSARVDVGFPINARGGDYIGFTVAAASGLLDADVLGGLSIVTYDPSGSVRETISGASLLQLRLLSGTTDRYTVGFRTTPGNYRIAKVRLIKTAVVGLLTTMRVYNAFFYSLNRPPVTVTPSGPVNFCEGGSVTLTAYDSLGAGNYVWSTGAVGNSITVSESGTYSVSVTDSFSCMRMSAPIEVIKNPLPQPRIIGDTVLCGSGSGNLSLDRNYPVHVWNTGATSSNISATVGRYYVTVTDSNGCSGADTVQVVPGRLAITAAVTQATCVSSSNGALNVSVSGGSGNYAYAWSTGATSASVASLSPGIYTVTVTDNVYGCAYRRDFTVTAANNLSLQHTLTATSACGKSDGKIALNVIGGSGSYSYLWSNGATGSVADKLSAGIYTVTVNDASSGCSLRDTFALGNGTATHTLLFTSAASSSCSTPNGTASVTVSGGSGTYAYLWSNGATTSSISGLRPGRYFVAVTDVSSGCVSAGFVQVNSQATLNVNASVKPAGCGKADGSITINSVSGGTGPYTYAWADGGTAAALSGLRSGVYTVTVADGGSVCTTVKRFTVSDSFGPSVTTNITQTDCSNGNGAIAASSIPANTVLRWSDGSSGASISGLKPGIYSLMATDTNTLCSTTYLFELRAKPALSINASPKANTACASAANGSITATIEGGTAPYTYSWSSGETSLSLSGKTAGNYTLSVTDAAGCAANITVPLQTDSSKLLRAVVTAITKAACNTSATGSISVDVSGGQTPYTYSWTPGGATTKNLINALPGAYTLTVTDALGCATQVSAVIDIDLTAAINIKIDSTRASGCASSASGAVFVTVTSGTPPLTYEWRKAGVFVAATEDIVNVTSGTYTLKVTDASGCTATATATVGVLPGSIVVVQDSVKRPTCSISGDGAIYTSVSGGLAPYAYSWSSGQTTDDVTGLNAGTYVLTVTDANGCPGQLIVTLNFDTAKSVAVKVDSLRGTACAAGSGAAVYVTATGGTMPYVYTWSNGSVGEDLLNVPIGNYTLTVTDARGCKVNVTANTMEDTARSLRPTIVSSEGAACIGSRTGSIKADVSRGTAPYTFTWSNGSTGKDLTNVAPGTYTLNVMDGEGCTATLSAAVGIDPAKAVRITGDSVRGASCLAGTNGGIFVTVTGGSTPYNYLWSNGATTEDLVNVRPGLYSLRVQDAYGCTAEYANTVSVDAGKAIVVTAATVKNAACSGNASGAADVNVSGGVPPYTYNWSNGATTKAVSNLVPGSYTVLVRDVVGCTGELSLDIKTDTGNRIKISAQKITAAACAGSASGAVSVTVEGGVSPYTYSWSTGAKSKDLSYVMPGSYLLTVTDAQGCTGSFSVVIGIDASNPVRARIDSVRGVGCADTMSGAVYASASGGTAPYSFLWSTGAVTRDLVNVGKGTYTLQVTDDAGCAATVSTEVKDALPLNVTAEITSAGCYGAADGSIALKVANGSGRYMFAWRDGSTDQNRSNLPAGDYYVTATDLISKCTADNTFRVVQGDSLALQLFARPDSCLAGADGSIELNVSGGSTPYSFSWSNGAMNASLQNLAPGSYTVNVTDARGCKATATAIVGKADCNTNVVVHDVLTPNGDGMNDFFTIEGVGLYPQNKLQIVDKWGDLVYEQQAYNNTFDGRNSKTGDALPSGTYYYILQLNAPDKTKEENTFKGALLLKR